MSEIVSLTVSSKDKKMIPVTCDPDDRLERLTEMPRAFQGDMKSLDRQRYDKLKASMERHGFFAPVYVWHDEESSTTWTLDGHQRVYVLENEGWQVDGGIPVVRIEAESARDAAEKVVLMASTYGKIDQQGLYDFTEMYGLQLPSWDLHDLPDFNYDDYVVGFYGEPTTEPTNDPVNVGNQWAVVVECDSEDAQASALEKLTAEGFVCRALTL